MSRLANQVATEERDDVARGIRMLLASPLISERVAPESFDLVRRRRVPIIKWFEHYCGWSVHVEPRLGYARLLKVRAADDPSRPATRQRTGRAPFDRRRYTLLCVAAAELLNVPVTTIGLLADRIALASAADEVLGTFDTASRPERMAYVDVLRLLEFYGVLEVLDGSTESYVDSAEAKVLYRVDTTLLLRLLAAPVGPSRLGVPVAEIGGRFTELLSLISQETRYGMESTTDGSGSSATQRNLWLRHSTFRRLMDDPVLYYDDLSEAQLGYLTSPTGRNMMRAAAEQAGFVLEERAEGVLLVDTDRIATDTTFPDDASTAKVAALLLLDTLSALDGPRTVEQLRSRAAELLNKFPNWAKKYQGEHGPAELVADALPVLTRFALARVHNGSVYPLPAAARYAVDELRTREPAQQEVEDTPR